jgi:hypothetical protein
MSRTGGGGSLFLLPYVQEGQVSHDVHRSITTA